MTYRCDTSVSQPGDTDNGAGINSLRFRHHRYHHRHHYQHHRCCLDNSSLCVQHNLLPWLSLVIH